MRLWKALITASILVILAAAGCRGGAPALDLEGTAWELSTIDGAPVVPASHPTIAFDGGQVSGNASCNSFFGEAKYHSNGTIAFGELGWTLMACIEPEGLMEQEAAYMQALAETTGFSITGGHLEFTDTGGEVRLIFEAMDTK